MAVRCVRNEVFDYKLGLAGSASSYLVLLSPPPQLQTKQNKNAHFPLSHWQHGLFHLAPLKGYKRLILQGMDEMQISILFM